jgi:hypothetical protein
MKLKTIMHLQKKTCLPPTSRHTPINDQTTLEPFHPAIPRPLLYSRPASRVLSWIYLCITFHFAALLSQTQVFVYQDPLKHASTVDFQTSSKDRERDPPGSPVDIFIPVGRLEFLQSTLGYDVPTPVEACWACRIGSNRLYNSNGSVGRTVSPVEKHLTKTPFGAIACTHPLHQSGAPAPIVGVDGPAHEIRRSLDV